MKKLLITLIVCLPILTFAAGNSTADQNAKPTASQQPSSESSSNQFNKPFVRAWDWTKNTSQNVADKTTPALKTGWKWTKSHAILIGRGFKEGGEKFYKTVAGDDKNKKTNGSNDEKQPHDQGGVSNN